MISKKLKVSISIVISISFLIIDGSVIIYSIEHDMTWRLIASIFAFSGFVFLLVAGIRTWIKHSREA